MSWTRETPSSSPPFQPITRALIIVITASLSLVAGLIGLLAAMIGLFAWQALRPARLPTTEPETEFQFVR